MIADSIFYGTLMVQPLKYIPRKKYSVYLSKIQGRSVK